MRWQGMAEVYGPTFPVRNVGFKILIIWIPSYCGIVGKDHEDRLAGTVQGERILRNFDQTYES